MKNIFKLFSLLMVLLVTMVACEEEAEWFGDYTGDGAAYVQFSDTDWNFGLFTDADGVSVTPESYPLYVKIIGPAQKTDVSVGIKVATGTTGASGEWSISSMVATIPAGALSGSVMVSINKASAVYDSTYVIKLTLDEATSDLPVYGNAAATAEVMVKKGLSCALDLAMFGGDFYYKTQFDYEPNPVADITVDEDASTLAIVTTWDEMGPTSFTLEVGDEVDPNMFEVTGENEMSAWNGDLTSWGLGADCTFTFEDFNSGVANSCTGEFSIAVTPWILDNGSGSWYWWGGEMLLEFVPGAPPAKKSVSLRSLDPSKLVKVIR